MSYALFDRGYTAEQIKGMHKPSQDDLLTERLRQLRESEHVLNIIRYIRATDDMDKEQKVALWVKATKRRR